MLLQRSFTGGASGGADGARGRSERIVRRDSSEQSEAGRRRVREVWLVGDSEEIAREKSGHKRRIAGEQGEFTIRQGGVRRVIGTTP